MLLLYYNTSQNTQIPQKDASQHVMAQQIGNNCHEIYDYSITEKLTNQFQYLQNLLSGKVYVNVKYYLNM